MARKNQKGRGEGSQRSPRNDKGGVAEGPTNTTEPDIHKVLRQKKGAKGRSHRGDGPSAGSGGKGRLK